MRKRDKSTFGDRLAELEMSPAGTGQLSGLFLVDAKTVAEPAVRIALEQAERYGADAVFFRRIPDGTVYGPLPQIYFYDRTQDGFDRREFGEIQRRLWNAGAVPLAAVLAPEQVKLFNCQCQPEWESKRFVCRPFEALEAAVAAETAFLRRAVASGVLWDDPRFADGFRLGKSAYRTLLAHLSHFKRKLLNAGQLDAPVAKRLLVLAILLKYLDERRDATGRGVFPDGFFAQFAGANCMGLPDLFKQSGASVKLFDHLGARFNGGIFSLSKEERQSLERANLDDVAAFLKGTVEPTGQQVFWPLYSFNDLPVELISNIYEEFLAKDGENSGGVVYTPPLLVEFLLDQSLPLAAESAAKTVFDPACGSGIFLVGAFRRLVHCWRMSHDWRTPNHEDLKRILRESIFGSDKEAEAVLVAAFSLCVALCDQLEPKVIWDELRFDDLRKKNLQARDFFDLAASGEFAAKFDLVIGNPPFGSNLTTEAARRVEEEAAKQRPGLPDGQLALLFLDQSFGVCRPGGTVCLIQPAGPLLYNLHACEFRNYLFDRYEIQTVFDFTPLERVLFKADVAAAAILARNREPSGDELLHLIFRRTRAAKDRLLLEADYYDFHRLGREYVKSHPHAWKVDLLGGGRLHRLVERFEGVRTLGDFLRDREEAGGWKHGEGFIVGCGGKPNRHPVPDELSHLSEAEIKQRFHLKRAPLRAPYLTGRLCVPSEAIMINGIDETQLYCLSELFFEKPRRGYREVFSTPHVLVREVVRDGRIPAVYSDQDLAFGNQVYGIHAPPEQEGELQELARRLSQSDLLAALLAATSGRYLVSRDTSLLATDLMSIPYPEQSDLALAEWEEEVVADVAHVLVEFRQRGERATATQATTAADRTAFGTTYCRVLSAVYKGFRPLEPVLLGGFVCFPFCVGDTPEIKLPATAKDAVAVLENLCSKRQGPRLFVNRIIRLYEKNVVIMVKPDQKRFWLRSVALRDADETVAELISAGY